MAQVHEVLEGEPLGELVGEPVDELVGEPMGEPVGEPEGEPVGDSARVQPKSSPSESHKRPACEQRGLSLSGRNGRKPGCHT